MARLHESLPDIVISDLAMPEQDGYDLLRQVQTHFRNLPVMALTAHARAEDQERALAAGFKTYLSKPVEPIRLAKAVAVVLRRQRGMHGAAETEPRL